MLMTVDAHPRHRAFQPCSAAVTLQCRWCLSRGSKTGPEALVLQNEARLTLNLYFFNAETAEPLTQTDACGYTGDVRALD